MKRTLLLILFGAVFFVTLADTVRASLVRSAFDNAPLLADPWFQATLLDAYFGFLTFYVWVAWKERTAVRRVAWFVLIMALGNLATSGYVIMQLLRLPPESDVAEVLSIRPNV